MRLSIA